MTPTTNPRALVRGDAGDELTFLMRIAIWAGVGVAIYLYSGPYLGAAWLIGGISVETWRQWRRWQVRWIEDTGDGFIVSDRNGSRKFRDEQVVALAWDRSTRYQEARLEYWVESFQVWLADEPRPVAMTLALDPDAQDPLAALRARLFMVVHARAERELAQDRSCAGDGWRLDRSGIEWDERFGHSRISYKNLICVEVHDQRVSVWGDGERPVLTIPAASRNACLVPRLLEPYIRPRPEQESPAGLGRLLFEVRTGMTPLGVLIVSSLVFGGLGLFLVLIEWLWLGGTLLALALGLSARALRWAGLVLCCHERGLRLKTLFGQEPVPYEDLVAIRHLISRQVWADVYVYAAHDLTFLVTTAGRVRRVGHIMRLRALNASLWQVCEQCILRISEQMERDLGAGKEVEWTMRLAFSPEGLVIRGPLRVPKIVAFDQISHIAFEMDASDPNSLNLVLWSKGSEKPIAKQADKVMNLAPGFRLLLRLTGLTEGAPNSVPPPLPPAPKEEQKEAGFSPSVSVRLSQNPYESPRES